MEVAIIGAGHVGLVSGVCFAEIGNKVIFIDNDEERIAGLRKGKLPIYEPGLKELLAKNMKRLTFTTSIKDGTKKTQIIFLCVGTPPKPSGDADLSAIENVTVQIAESMKNYKLVVEKSTVPVQTGIRVKKLMKAKAKKEIFFDVASNPEFLREGAAIYDFMHPDRIVIGVESEKAKKALVDLYKPIKAPILVTDIESAELIKHASNSLLATKISFINAVARVCELSGANIEHVAKGIGLDNRIGKEFLEAGIGFGGSCFPKDLKAFRKISEKMGYEFKLLEDVEKINEAAKNWFITKLENTLWNLRDKEIGILGLAFKPNTEDMREAPSIDIIKTLQKEGAKIRTYDPEAMLVAKKIFKKITYCKNPYEVARGADCLCILTEWEEFKKLNLQKIKELLKTPIIIDGRNVYDKTKMEKLGFTYKGVGR